MLGSMGYVQAARELAAQVREGILPEPDVCVVALGSGGTAAGLAAGFAAEGLKTRVVGVCVSSPPWALRLVSLSACARVREAARRARRHGRCAGASRWTRASSARATATRSAAGDEATVAARDGAGLTLDPTYTAKAFASALWHVRARRGEARPLLAHALERADGPLARRRARAERARSGAAPAGDGARCRATMTRFGPRRTAGRKRLCRISPGTSSMNTISASRPARRT